MSVKSGLASASTSATTATAEPRPLPSRPPAPRPNVLAFLFFSWLTPLIWKGSHGRVTDADIFELTDEQTADRLLAIFQSPDNWSWSSPSVYAPLWVIIRRPLIIASLLSAYWGVCQVLQPLLLREFLYAVDDETRDDGVKISFMLFTAVITGFIAMQHQTQIMYELGQRLRAVLIAVVYRQAMRTNVASMSHISMGAVVNLMSNDTQKFFDVFPQLNIVWVTPCLLFASSYFLIEMDGWAAMFSVGFLLTLIPATTYMSKFLHSVRAKHMPLQDKRVRLCSEVLGGIKVVKYFGWEENFLAKIFEIRALQMVYVRKEMRVYFVTIFVMIIFQMISAFIHFTAVVFLTYELKAAHAFSTLMFFNILRFPMNFIGKVVSSIAQCGIAAGRLDKFVKLKNSSELMQFMDAVTVHKEAATGGAGGEKTEKKTDGGETGLVDAEHLFYVNQSQRKEENEVGAAASLLSSVERTTEKEVEAKAGQLVEVGGGLVDGEAAISVLHGYFRWQGPSAISTSTAGAAVISSAASSSAAVASAVKGSTSPHVSDAAFSLNDICLTVKPGELVAVVGVVGSGKSTLLFSLLGETHKERGEVSMRGNVAYVAQEAWIMAASVRENIVFGAPWDADWYEHVLSACCLWPDLAILTEADRTMIGEKGVTLSGGQKQRVSLARCVYSRPHVALLDDPFSALDSHTGKTVYNNLFGANGLLTRCGSASMLVTHATHYLHRASKVLVVHEGCIPFMGPYRDLLAVVRASNPITTSTKTNQSTNAPPPSATTSTTATTTTNTNTPSPSSPTSTNGAQHKAGGSAETQKKQRTRHLADLDPAIVHALLSTLTLSTQESGDKNEESGGNEGKRADQDGMGPAVATMRAAYAHIVLDRNEHAQHHVVKQARSDDAYHTLFKAEDTQNQTGIQRETYHAYYIVAGAFSWLGLCAIFIVFERIIYSGMDWWLAVWTSSNQQAPDFLPSSFPPPDSEAGHMEIYWAIYAGFLFFIVVSTTLRCWNLQVGGALAAERLFVQVVTAVIRSPMVYFETTPHGRILNLLSYDIEILDGILIQTINGTFASSFWVMAGLVVIASVAHWMALFLAFIVIIFFTLSVFYRRAVVQLQRLDSVSRSPLQAHFSESLQGIVTIRSYRASRHFIAMVDAKINDNSRAVLTRVSAAQWLGMRTDVMGSLIQVTTMLVCWALRSSISDGLAGLAAIWAFNFTVSMNFYITNTTQMEEKMDSVARILQSVHLPAEPPLHIHHTKPTNDWPQTGKLVFRNVVMRYRPLLEPALRGLSFSVAAGERVAVVGRTGAGKSSLATAIFRLRECESGSVEVDGVDLATLGLSEVRGRNICIIPQEPVLFTGTVRFNLDPFHQHTDEELWQALRHVRMDRDLMGEGEGGGGGACNTLKRSSAATTTPAIAATAGTATSSVAAQQDAKNGVGLDTMVIEAGSNFSLGQRQLLCLARALLRQPTLLVLDEATASVDHETDMFIQVILRTHLKKCTLLTIAHRLATIMDYDKVLVMDKGVVVEFDAPRVLLQNHTGQFSSLVDSVGTKAAASLRAMVH